MLIDWFTVGAQALNFLVLVWLMKRFLYRPILAAIDGREKLVAADLAAAAAKTVDAQNARDAFQHKNQDFDQQRAALLKKATDEGNAERQRLLDEARKDTDTLRASAVEALQKRTAQPESRNHPLDPTRGLCHCPKDTGRPRQREPRGAHRRGVRPAPARVDWNGKGTVGDGPQDLDPRRCQPRCVRSAGAADDDTKSGSMKLLGRYSHRVRNRSRNGHRNRTLRQRAEGGLEHRGISRDAGKERQRTSTHCREARAEGRSQRSR